MKWPEWQGRSCPYCGRTMGYGRAEGDKAWPSLDHKVPRERGGTGEPGELGQHPNLIIVCHGCNITKATLTMEEFLQYKQLLGVHYRFFEAALWPANLGRRIHGEGSP